MNICVETAAPSDLVVPVSPLSKKRSWFPRRWLGPTTARVARRFPHIVHVAVDAFFASIEQLRDPTLAGKPIVVGRGVVIAASHEAILRGVKIGMNFSDALLSCPDAIVVPAHYCQYSDFAARVRRILETYAPTIESAGLDDFYLNFAGTEGRYPDFEVALRRMQAEILDRTGLSVSVGASRSKTVACVASRLEPPRGFRIVEPGEEQAFLWPLPVEKLNGIGQIYAADLVRRGISTIGQLRMVPKPALTAAFGDVIGRHIWESARGRDTRELRPAVSPKCVSRETLIEGGSSDRELLAGILWYLNEHVGRTLKERDKQASVLGFRLIYIDDFFVEQTIRLTRPTRDVGELLAASSTLFTRLFTRNVPIRAIRLSVPSLGAECA
jgi:DNA polymerase IV